MSKTILLACAATGFALYAHPAKASELTFHQALQKPAGSIFNFSNPSIKVESEEGKAAEIAAASTTEPPLPTPAPGQKVVVAPLKEAAPGHKVRADSAAPPPDSAAPAAPVVPPIMPATQADADLHAGDRAPVMPPLSDGVVPRPAEPATGAPKPVSTWAPAGLGLLFIGLSALVWWTRRHRDFPTRVRRIQMSFPIGPLWARPRHLWHRADPKPVRPSREVAAPVQAPAAIAGKPSLDLAVPIELSLAWGNRDHAARLISSRRRAVTGS